MRHSPRSGKPPIGIEIAGDHPIRRKPFSRDLAAGFAIESPSPPYRLGHLRDVMDEEAGAAVVDN